MIQSYLELPVWDAVPHTKCQDPVISCGYQGAGPTPLGFSEESALRNNKIKLFLHTLNGTAPKQPQRDIDTLAEGSKEGRKKERKKERSKEGNNLVLLFLSALSSENPRPCSTVPLMWDSTLPALQGFEAT